MPQHVRRPLVLTQGDRLGVGPELILAAAARGVFRPGDQIVADVQLLQEVAHEVGTQWARDGLAALHSVEVWGAPGLSAVEALRAAVDRVLEDPARALVTAPIHKGRAARAGLPTPGHTEYLAQRSGVTDYAMAMMGPRLRVSLVTIHEPLCRVPKLLSAAKVIRSAVLLARGLRDLLGVSRPRIGVLGLNPHAGEGGLLGFEDDAVIAPAVKTLVEVHGESAEFSGPWAADTAFAFHGEGRFDGLVAMYHDQGLAPFKLWHLHDGVNVTLGLPFLRTSPDHGTADDIARTGRVDPRSFLAAVSLAAGLGLPPVSP